MQRLCNHKTGIHEVIVLEFEIRTVCRDKSNIDFVLGQIGNINLVKDLGFASVSALPRSRLCLGLGFASVSAFISYIDLVLSLLFYSVNIIIYLDT